MGGTGRWAGPAHLACPVPSASARCHLSLILCAHPLPRPPAPHHIQPTGLDSAEIVSQMRAAHAADPDTSAAGVDVVTGGVGNMKEVCCGVWCGGVVRCC